MITFDESRREEIAVSIRPEKRPVEVFNFYVVYEYNFKLGGPYCLGFNRREEALIMLKELRAKTNIADAQMTNWYPYEVMMDGGKKSNSKKPELKKPGPQDVQGIPDAPQQRS